MLRAVIYQEVLRKKLPSTIRSKFTRVSYTATRTYICLAMFSSGIFVVEHDLHSATPTKKDNDNKPTGTGTADPKAMAPISSTANGTEDNKVADPTNENKAAGPAKDNKAPTTFL
jgi:hypothetical protein